MPQQLTLPIQLYDDATFANFYTDKNTVLIKALQALILQPVPILSLFMGTLWFGLYAFIAS